MINGQTLEQEVNEPKHYRSHESGIEAIEITRWLQFDLGNCWKYCMRYRDKERQRKTLRRQFGISKIFMSTILTIITILLLFIEFQKKSLQKCVPLLKQNRQMLLRQCLNKFLVSLHKMEFLNPQLITLL